ncbi:PAAR domain-containing protein [Aquimarina algicola]|uniref:PAAR domain-containing protein n=1 Tax=Aquimarina algicola TaxID=2589995 RepID=A0A504J456_9FLAO|nr:PAAR domain-containing protein [Aquimarina algicola]TPN82748.1 hypothetical protein FHK87_20180 [Aquimarina algicola]
MAKPIAVVGSMHTCPMHSGSTPHVGGPITGPGATGVTINGQPISLQGDTCSCVGAIDTIVQGSAGVTINGIPIVTVDCMTAHGGIVTTGIPGVTITTNTPDAIVTMANNKIPIEKTSVLSNALTVLSGNSNEEAFANQEMLREETEGEPLLYNPKWIKDEIVQRHSKQIRQITLLANVRNIPDGQTITFTFDVPEIFERPEETITLSGVVANKQVEAIWEIEDLEETDNNV